ncbi:Fur family transcriptional regulator [Oceanobacillus sp. Castelsardo]|uniref:Fur family transcriptional regulator n=1 Tax=Oceanobacillus sp. Castelsardo TaxID=1851204 RepID=UPI0008384A16|nr:Fur family transcriptional regulator [Oceanobacillus sp. Castelsardo]
MNVNEALDLLKSNGYKATGKRKDILDYFAEQDGYRTAKDLIIHLENGNDTVSFDTIYRNLHLYNEMGILETTELSGEKHFRMNCGNHHHHHFICNECGRTKAIDVCPMDDVKKSLVNYAIEGHKFEIYGLCPTCQNN